MWFIYMMDDTREDGYGQNLVYMESLLFSPLVPLFSSGVVSRMLQLIYRGYTSISVGLGTHYIDVISSH